MALFVAFVTTGYDKYEFKTHIAGLYWTKKSAYIPLLDMMERLEIIHDTGRRHEDQMDELGQSDLPTYPDRKAKVSAAHSEDEALRAFRDALRWFGDSFEGTGWSWAIEEHEAADVV